jgi:O-antigen/teichoic acid export membrane protein
MYSRIIKNASLLWVAKAVNLFLGLFISARLARYLSVEGYGLYGYIYSLSHLLIILTNFRIGTTLVRELSQQEDEDGRSRILGAGLSARVVLSLVGVLVVVLFVVVGDYDVEAAWSLIVCSLSFVCLFFTQTAFSVFRSAERMEYELCISTLNTLLYAVLITLVAWLDMGLVSVFVSKLVAEFVPFVVAAYIVVTRFQVPVFQGIRHLSFEIFRMSIPLGISLVVKRAYLQLGTVALQLMAGEVAVGLFRPASQLYENLRMFPLYAAIAVYPFLSRRARDTDKRHFFRRYHELFKYFLVAALGLSLGLWTVADEMIVFVFGREFAPASLPLRILAGTMPFVFLNQLLGYLLASIDRQDREAINYVISVFLFLSTVLALIPSLSYVGVAVAIMISETLLFLLNYYSASKFTGRVPFGGVGRSILSFSIAAAAIFVLPHGTYWLVQATLAELTYSVALLVSGAFSKQEVTAFVGEFRRLSAALLRR